MTIPLSLKERLTSAAELLIRERLNILAAVLASNGASVEDQHHRLDRLVFAIRDASLEEVIADENGHQIPVEVRDYENPNDQPKIVFNETMLQSISDVTGEMLIDSLSRPIAKMLHVPTATVAIVLHEQDEQRLRELSVKLVSAVDSEVINYTSLRSVQIHLLHRFFLRIAKVTEVLSGGIKVPVVDENTPGMKALIEHTATFSHWPVWSEIRGKNEENIGEPYSQPLNQVVQNTCKALAQTPWLSTAVKIIKIVWNCSDLAHRSFLIEGGRKLRSNEVSPASNVLMAIAEAIGQDSKELSLRLEDWPRFTELQRAMERLYIEESAIFGSVCEHSKGRKPVSVIDIASRAFGIHEPEELPWNMPLLCWTQRETDALRDLFLGKRKTTFGTVARCSCRRTYDFGWHGTGKSEIEMHELDKMPSVQIIPIGSVEVKGIIDALSIDDFMSTDLGSNPNSAPEPQSLVEKCWKASFKQLKDNFANLSPQLQTDTISNIRKFYDHLKPDMAESWARRFDPLISANSKRAFSALSRELAEIIGKPCLIDPFESISDCKQLDFPRLVFVSPLCPKTKVSVVWIPIDLLAATKSVGPIIIRLIEEKVPSDNEKKPTYTWLRDIPIHIDVFEGQPKDVIFQCIYCDALQFVISL